MHYERNWQSNKKYREYEVDFNDFNQDLDEKKEQVKFSDLELIFKDLKIII